MRTQWHAIWGCATGPVTSAGPRARLLAGFGVFATCLVAPVSTLAGSTWVVVSLAAWLAACRPPGVVLRATLGLGFAAFLPWFLLPLLPDFLLDGRWSDSETVLFGAWTVAFRGICGMLACTATVTCLGPGELREALSALPLPALATRILVQMVHQSATLAGETRRIAAAMAVRGAVGSGPAAWRVLVSIPRAWLPRVLFRAERVGAAMELRGYCDPANLPARKWALGDVLLLSLAGLVLGVAIVLRGVDA